MSSTAQAMINHGLFEDHQEIPTQIGGSYPLPTNLSFTPFGCNQSLKIYTTIPSSLVADASPSLNDTLLTSSTSKQIREDIINSHIGTQLLSLQSSSANLWGWGDANQCLISNKRSHGGEDHLGVSSMKMKKIKARRKVREPRFCFKTMSDVDVLDDGYKWRKYGQKVVKNTQHPRSYYRCTQDNCRVKKRVERLAEDPRMVITTYEGRHIHSPSHDLEDSQDPSQANIFFW
ncbi:WRKY domain [Dillenia turbinata]|uniref:WRKY domain n=1 Tax=Dillenia turbinata TaxID=194707 RepID=A0AAN8Z374_9MAGN